MAPGKKKAEKNKAENKAAEKKAAGVDPTWPEGAPDDHAVTEFIADRQGALSPFGELEFPLPADEIPYVHPVTVINR